MTDRELLELAAKAAGLIIRWSDSWGCYQRFVGPVDEPMSDWLTWRPLADDGDALRLAVKLGLGISIALRSKRTDVVTFDASLISSIEAHGDSLSATRRAIVRAAAEIGRRMP